MFNFDNEKPIYLQIYEDLLKKVFREEIRLGDKLPSVRELALNYTVNPNTIQKVISELEREKIIIIERGKGTYLTNDVELINQLRLNVIKNEVSQFITKLIHMGMKEKEILLEVMNEVNTYDSNK